MLGPRFDGGVDAGGYAWWYVDGISDDGQSGITVIGLIGSVFSTYYARSGHRDPLDHCAVNVALYGRRGGQWAMTERGRRAVRAGASELSIGPSSFRWDGNALLIDIDEVTSPFPSPFTSRLKGTIRLTPAAMTRQSFALDAGGRHQWWPIAPEARIEVAMSHPGVSWSGQGYFDTNRGLDPLETAFKSWNWSYARMKNGPVLFYDVLRRDGSFHTISAKMDKAGAMTPVSPPPVAGLSRSRWLMRRSSRADPAYRPQMLRSLEDTPFYSRSILKTRLWGEEATGMHESLCLDRLTSPIVRYIIPYRNPRA